MTKVYRILAVIMTALLLVSCMPADALMENSAVQHGEEDLSRLTYKELLQLQSDISLTQTAYHSLTDALKKSVLAAVQTAAKEYYTKLKLVISGWAWYDSEYTYTRDWDFYTLKTHLDYKDRNNKSQQATIYAEVHNEGGNYIVSFLKSGNDVVIDKRSGYKDKTLWFKEPAARTNKVTGIDLSTYTVQELKALNNKAQKEIENNHTVSRNEANIILSLSKSELEQYFLNKNYELKSYAWYDNEYTYLKDWDYYSLETHVDYKTDAKASQKTDTLYSEVARISGTFELVYLRFGNVTLRDRRDELEINPENDIPRYSWNNTAVTERSSDIAAAAVTPEVVYVTAEPGAEPTPQIVYVTPAPDSVMTPEIVYVTPEPTAEITPQIIYITPAPADSIFAVELAELTDDELLKAAEAIQAEQRSRIKTHIVLDSTDLTIFVGKTQKIGATVTDLPEGEKEPKFVWSTSDKKVATCNNGQIKAVSGGNAVITCGATLADGTYIYEECRVQVDVPVASITADKKNLNMKGGEKIKPLLTVKPENASNKALAYESSDPNVASVSEDGTIEGTGTGNATITVRALDGSGKSVSISVKVTDNRISKDTVEKLLMYATCNDVAEDVFTSDGMNYDKNKLHSYYYFDSLLTVIDEGAWVTMDGGNTWRVRGFLVKHKIYEHYRKYDFDIRFDGKNYILENGWVVYAGKVKWLDKSDPSKYGEDSLSNLEFYKYLTVSPKQVSAN